MNKKTVRKEYQESLYLPHATEKGNVCSRWTLLKVYMRRRGRQRMRWLDGITDTTDMSLSELPGDGDGQGGLACCDSCSCKESDTTERLNWTELLHCWQMLYRLSYVGSLMPGLGRSPGEGTGYPLQYSSLENSMDCIVHGVAKSWTWLSNFHFNNWHQK